MHSIHTTPGFIIDSRAYGEAGKIYSIFTREFGLIRAAAQGVRLEKSKLRYQTIEYSLGVFSCVRGKEYWRLTNAEYMSAGGSLKEIAARIAQLLRRLLHGEERHEMLFGHIDSFFNFADAASLDSALLPAVESLVVLRILHSLGYIGADKSVAPYIADVSYSLELLAGADKDKKAIYMHINNAFKVSHL